MYKRAKNPAFNQGKNLQFYQFQEWIQKDLNKSVYNIEPQSARSSTGLNGLKDF